MYMCEAGRAREGVCELSRNVDTHGRPFDSEGIGNRRIVWTPVTTSRRALGLHRHRHRHRHTHTHTHPSPYLLEHDHLLTRLREQRGAVEGPHPAAHDDVVRVGRLREERAKREGTGGKRRERSGTTWNEKAARSEAGKRVEQAERARTMKKQAKEQDRV